jgi:hypothetical protein
MSSGNVGHSQGFRSPASMKAEQGHVYKWLKTGESYTQTGTGVSNAWVVQGSGGGGANGIFSAVNNGGLVPTGFNAGMVDSLTWDGTTIYDYTGPAPTPIYEENFDSGTLGDFTTSSAGASPAVWTIDIGHAAGTSPNSARSGAIGHSSTTSLLLTKSTVSNLSFLAFDYELSTEDDFDGMQIYIDGNLELDIRTSTVGFIQWPEPSSNPNSRAGYFKFFDVGLEKYLL